MSHEGKIKTLTDYAISMDSLRYRIKVDCREMVKKCPLEVLTDPSSLESYMQEMLQVIINKYVIDDSGKVNKNVVAMIQAYVNGLTADM